MLKNIKAKNNTQLLGVDRIKLLLPTDNNIDYSKFFDTDVIKRPKAENYISTYRYPFKKNTPEHCRINIKETCKEYEVIRTEVEIDVNIPKFIYGNNVFESTYDDLYRSIKKIHPLLKDICDIEDLYSAETSYLENARNIISKSNKAVIDNILKNTHSYNRNSIKFSNYNGNGYGCILANKHKIVSYYDKNLEVEYHDSSNPILNCLQNVQLLRFETKYGRKEELNKIAKKYLNKDNLTLHDILTTNLLSTLLLDTFNLQKKNSNTFDIYNLPMPKVIEIIDYIEKKFKGNKKECLIALVRNAKDGVKFDLSFELLKKYSKNYPMLIVKEFNNTMLKFKVPYLYYFTEIYEDIIRTQPLQETNDWEKTSVGISIDTINKERGADFLKRRCYNGVLENCF